jgi:hypothetical protein
MTVLTSTLAPPDKSPQTARTRAGGAPQKAAKERQVLAGFRSYQRSQEDFPAKNPRFLERSHVVGRKTWYGTHSERGAAKAAILFLIVETCKLNQVNPRENLEKLAQDLLEGQSPYAPQKTSQN